MSFIQNVSRFVLPRPSAWRLAAAGGGGATAGFATFAYLGYTGGTFYMAMGDGPHQYPLLYSGPGAGAGVGLPVLGAVDVYYSAAHFPSTHGEWGRLYLPPGAPGFNIDSISGQAVLLNPGSRYDHAAAMKTLLGVARRFRGLGLHFPDDRREPVQHRPLLITDNASRPVTACSAAWLATPQWTRYSGSPRDRPFPARCPDGQPRSIYNWLVVPGGPGELS